MSSSHMDANKLKPYHENYIYHYAMSSKVKPLHTHHIMLNNVHHVSMTSHIFPIPEEATC